MKLYRFDRTIAEQRTDFGSKHFGLVRILQTTTRLNVVCIYLDPGSSLAWHQAKEDQLFMIVEGEGEVIGYDKQPTIIKAGEAAFWESGEWHETRTQSGLTAVALEGSGLNPVEFMTEMK